MDTPGNGDVIRVLHVDDDAAFVEMAAEMLQREDDRFDVSVATSAGDGLERLGETAVDCVVSDYDMPGRNGIEFLDAVRADHPDLPFILFTGQGSESVASDAVSAGVTDYLQKGSGSEQYELLATRIETAVGQYRAERELERQHDLFRKAQDIAGVGAWEYDVESGRSYVTDEVLRIHGLEPGDSLPPEDSISYYHPEDRDDIREAFTAALEAGEPYDLELRLVAEGGDQRWVRTRGEPQTEGGEIVRVRGTLQDVTDRKRRERKLQRQNERLENFAHVVSHDIRAPLNVAIEQLAVAERTGEPDAFEDVRESHGRIEAIVEDVLTLARQGQDIGDVEPVSITEVARSAWESRDDDDVTLRTLGDCRVVADPGRLRQLFENLLANAVTHAGPEVTVSVGPIESFSTTTRASSEALGFYVADDGPGVPEEERERVFDAGYSTADDGTGFGLSIVEGIVEAHGWDVRLVESADGGARFEVTGVEVSDDDPVFEAS